MKHVVSSTAVLAAVWLLWSGHYTGLILSFIKFIFYNQVRLGKHYCTFETAFRPNLETTAIIFFH